MATGDAPPIKSEKVDVDAEIAASLQAEEDDDMGVKSDPAHEERGTSSSDPLGSRSFLAAVVSSPMDTSGNPEGGSAGPSDAATPPDAEPIEIVVIEPSFTDVLQRGDRATEESRPAGRPGHGSFGRFCEGSRGA